MKSVMLYNLLSGPGIGPDVSPASNLWHARNYEFIAERVYILMLSHSMKGKKVIRNGRTIVIAIGNENITANILKSPFRLHKLMKRLQPELSVTYEQVFLWWMQSLVNIFTKRKTIMIPLTLPGRIYQITGKSLSGKLPKWLEKIFRNWSMRMVDRAVTTNSLGEYKEWLLHDRIARKKLVVLDKMPEVVPTLTFTSQVTGERNFFIGENENYNLLVIGRLQKEKMADHAILAMAELIKKSNRYRLYIIGDGAEKQALEQLVKDNGLEKHVFFEGYKNSEEIIDYCKRMHVFVSPLTGGALREAALLKLPIVAYNTDWIKDELKPGHEYAAADLKDYRQMADQIHSVVSNPAFAEKLATNMYSKAQQLWSPTGLDKEFEKLKLNQAE